MLELHFKSRLRAIIMEFESLETATLAIEWFHTPISVIYTIDTKIGLMAPTGKIEF